MSVDITELTPEGRRLLWRLSCFCERWEGKLIRYETTGATWKKGRCVEKGLVRGHDGPYWNEQTESWEMNQLGVMGIGGWGSVVIMKHPGLEHHVDPQLLLSVEEITRYPTIGQGTYPLTAESLTTTTYEYEAIDLYCPYDCDAHGLCDWSENAGPEYKVFCPVHSREAYLKGQEIYHSDHGFDGSHPELEKEYHELTKAAYEKAGI